MSIERKQYKEEQSKIVNVVVLEAKETFDFESKKQ